jgi:ppGpp synthetase/RelA/SpoT-type nucleotidyltranferase
MSEPFDFQRHRDVAISNYASLRPTYESYADTLKNLLTICLKGHPIHKIESRAKSAISLGDKAARPAELDHTKPYYQDPLKQITDLCGARVIAYFPKALVEIERVINSEFEVIERSDKSVAFEKSGRLGYQSIHFLVRLSDERTLLREYVDYKNLVAEIQIRTILQHAWAEMEHDIQYKVLEQIPSEIRRRFAALAGLIEIADREFQAIQDADEDLRNSIKAEMVARPAMPNPPDQSTPLTAGAIASTLEVGTPALLLDTVTEATITGNYAEALERYSKMIERDPRQYTLFLGRAKARFLSGDRSGALADLDEAEILAPGSPAIRSARRQIEEGVVAAPGNARRHGVAEANLGHDELGRGNPAGALRHYNLAEALGLNKAFSCLNRAMAYVLLKKHDEAEHELLAVHPPDGTLTRVNVELVKAMNRIHNLRVPADLAPIQTALSQAGSFSLSLSPVRHLVMALKLERLPVDLRELLERL